MPAKTASAQVGAAACDDLTAELAEIMRQPAEIWQGLTLLLDAMLQRSAGLAGECRA